MDSTNKLSYHTTKVHAFHQHHKVMAPSSPKQDHQIFDIRSNDWDKMKANVEYAVDAYKERINLKQNIFISKKFVDSDDHQESVSFESNKNEPNARLDKSYQQDLIWGYLFVGNGDSKISIHLRSTRIQFAPYG